MFRLLSETPRDRAEVEWLLDLAFAPGRMVLSSYKLREGVDSIAALNTVARDEYDVVAGCIRYWPVSIGEARDPALLLGPVAVHPTRQGEGLGAVLIGETLDRAQELGWGRIILIGDAPYYERFGFSRHLTKKLDFPNPFNPDRLLGKELSSGAFDGCSGMIGTYKKKSTAD
ncbi:MAG: N-acetyltransferase [Pseudomonadota bacterium]